MQLLFKSFLFCILVLACVEVYVSRKAKIFSVEQPDLILILGSGTQIQDPLLQERLLRAQSAFQTYKNSAAANCLVLVSGNAKEASVMLDFLKPTIPEGLLKVHSTAKRTKDSFEYLKNNFPNAQNILIASNEFHKRRSLALANFYDIRAGWIAQPKIYKTELKHQIREVFGHIRFVIDSFLS